MLHKFTVSGFRCFAEKLTFDLGAVSVQGFYEHWISNWVVKTGIVLGNSGSGKTMLGHAILDLTRHLTDKKSAAASECWSGSDETHLTEFSYQFKFDWQDLSYEYGRDQSGHLVYERIVIDEEIFAEIDSRISSTASINAAGAEQLKRDFSSTNISLASYIHKNSVLNKNQDNACFEKFMKFTDGMLYFSALDVDTYLGFKHGHINIEKAIVSNGWLEDLSKFLTSCEVACELTAALEDGETYIGQRVGNRVARFMDVASPGVKNIVTYYFWLRTAESEKGRCFMMYVDDLDSLHHNAYSPIIKFAMKSSVQVIFATTSTSGLSMNETRPDCCYSLRNGILNSLLSTTKKHIRREHNLEKLYRSGAFE